MLLILLIE